MHSALSILNRSSTTVSVYIDGEPFFRDIVSGTKTRYKNVSAGSTAVLTLNNREKVIFDLWLPFSPDNKNILEVHNNYCFLITIPRS